MPTNSFVNTAGTFVGDQELQNELDIMAEAQNKGHEFIKLRLNRREIRRNAGVGVRFTGVQTIKGYRGGQDRDGMDIIDLEVKGGSLVFRLDAASREFTAYLLDDKTKAIYSEIGYNRDFIATHIVNKSEAEQPFYIESKGIMRDIEKRMQAIQKLAKNKEEVRKDEDAKSLVNINAQIEELKAKQSELLDEQNLSVKQGDLSNPKAQAPVQDKTAPPLRSGAIT